jgi:hypothetical protein
MSKFRLEGDVNLEFEVKYGLDGDLVIRVQVIPIEVNGKVYRVLVGEGDISRVPERTLHFIIDRLNSFLQRNKSLVEIWFPGIVGIEFSRYDRKVLEEEWKEILQGLLENELGNLMLRAYYRVKRDALQKVLEKNLFFLCQQGMILFRDLKRSGWLPKY